MIGSCEQIKGVNMGPSSLMIFFLNTIISVMNYMNTINYY